MIAYLVDSEWMVDLLKGRRDAPRVIASLAAESVAISIITYAELYEGAIGDTGVPSDSPFALVEGMQIIGIDLPIARRFGQMRSDLRTRGELIPDLDLFIAATALEKDLTLLTNDAHFGRIEGLKRRQR
jgi:predicted nucleic acid-binding protein